MAAQLRATALLRRTFALPLVLVAVAAGLGATTASAYADSPTTTEAAPAAAGWLARQATGGTHLESVFGNQSFPDPGLTIDGILGLAAVGLSDTASKAFMTWLNDPNNAGDFYYGDGDADPAHGFAAGSLGKLALAAQVTGNDPTSVDGRDLIATMLTLQGANGRFTDTLVFNGTTNDFNNGFNQSLATLALARTGTHAAATTSAAAWLATTKCTNDNGYPLFFDKAPGDPNCDSHADATAMVIQALLAAGDTADANAALDWLVSKQKADGGFTDEATVGTGLEDANSTGLAAQALRAGGRDAAADKAVQFLKTLQVGCAGPAANRGAIAYTSGPFDATKAVRATAQALLGFGGIGLGTLSSKGAKTDTPVLDCPVAAAPQLPVTGDPVRPIVFSGLAFIVVGAGLLVLLRRRRSAQV